MFIPFAHITAIAFALIGWTCFSGASEIVFDAEGFEKEALGEEPTGWEPFHDSSAPAVKVFGSGTKESLRCLRSRRSDSSGWAALSREFDVPQKRVMIEFSFAVSKTDGRSLNVWTHEPGGKDASQFNLCVQGGTLMQFDGRTSTWEIVTRNIRPTTDPSKPAWHRLRAIVDAERGGIDFWISDPDKSELPEEPITRHAYRTGLPIGAIDMVSGRRIAPDAYYLIDDLVVTGGEDLPMPAEVNPLPELLALWTGPMIPRDVEAITFAPGIEHQTVHRAKADGYKFLHGAAIVHHKGVLYANWANSPTHENGPDETLQGRRSVDGGKTWSEPEIIGPGFEGDNRHSHGVLFVHNDKVWAIGARWGAGSSGRRFKDLGAEAFVLNEKTDKWDSQGMVMDNCWPYDEPVRMGNGNLITGGQDKDGLPVVAISHGDDLTKWDSVLIPFDPRLKPIYAETTVWAEGEKAIAVIRGDGGAAWVSTSEDSGRTWSKAGRSNFPMPRAKAYLGKLSTGQLYLLSNLGSRDTLAISVGKPGELSLSRIWRIRHGKSEPPKFPGRAKSKQWSYPYGHEHDGRLYVVYSIGKEDCGMSVIPIDSLKF